jgi:hypothetical protein
LVLSKTFEQNVFGPLIDVKLEEMKWEEKHEKPYQEYLKKYCEYYNKPMQEKTKESILREYSLLDASYEIKDHDVIFKWKDQYKKHFLKECLSRYSYLEKRGSWPFRYSENIICYNVIDKRMVEIIDEYYNN